MIAVVGSFDGFHAGHRALLDEAARLARGAPWAVVTFTPHPGVFFGSNEKLLFSYGEKRAAAKFLGVPEVIELPFERIHTMSPVDFLEMLAGEYGASGIVVGDDFRFGSGAGGGAALIESFCAANALACSVVETIKETATVSAGAKISASALRGWYGEGRADLLRGALTFPCPISGAVVRGDGRGAGLGYPTANLSVPPEKMLPAEGVYAVSVLTGTGEAGFSGEAGFRPGAMFAGRPPMFADVREARLEVHILGFSGDLYGEPLTVFLEEFLRPPMTFGGRPEFLRDIASQAEKSARISRESLESSPTLYNRLRAAFTPGARGRSPR